MAAAGTMLPLSMRGLAGALPPALSEFGYGDVALASALHERQLIGSHAILMGLGDDELLKPFRMMGGMPAPGRDIGGWYRYDPDYQPGRDDAGFAPGHCFGQWVSALARGYAITGSKDGQAKAVRLNQLIGESISADFFEKARFPAYTYDKIVCGLIDAHSFAGDSNAFAILDKVTDIALPHLPGHAVEHDTPWRPGKDFSYAWDESYTMPENLYLAAERGAGRRYREMASAYLMDATFFDPLSQGKNVLAKRHAYSTVNSLSSGMQAYLADGSEKHFLAVKNAYEMLLAQSFATGGWGPDEQLRAPDSDDLFLSLAKTHHSFETPCGAYAHFKLTRYLLRATRESRYGDSMERVMYNTILGAKPLEPDGAAFYYADCNFEAKRVYSDHVWPCCAGTLPQIAADYRISAYFRDGGDVYVNLYIPSTLKWTEDGKPFSLEQKGNYPMEDTVRMTIAAPHAAKFGVAMRIPAWAEGASVAVNGKALPGGVAAGAFHRVERKWKGGDTIALTLPMAPRLEPVNERHPETVAVMRGPLVLFALGAERTSVSRKDLLAARQVEASQWLVEGAAASLKLAPFTGVGDSAYSTYLPVYG